MISTVVVTIGRNIGQEPMRYDQWVRFKRDVLAAVQAPQGTNVVQRPKLDADDGQIGMWEGVVCEDAATFVILVPSARAFQMRPRLKELAAEYRQDAIGFIVVDGAEHLIRT